MRYAPTPAEVEESFEIERNNPSSDADAEYRRRVALKETMDRNSGKCRSCSASIIWTVTDNGKKMPIDFDEVREGSRYTLSVKHGQLRSSFHDAFEQGRNPDAVGYTSHFATCPEADKHRRLA